MDIDKKGRTELKAYFVKNAIPTESNFAELIDGALNQKDDGVVKLAGNPLSIEAAAGTVATEKKALNLYESFADTSPAWVLSLTSGAAATPLGFGVSDGAGNLRLFIDRSSGNVGIGTASPTQKLHVAGNVQADGITFNDGTVQTTASKASEIGGYRFAQFQAGTFAVGQVADFAVATIVFPSHFEAYPTVIVTTQNVVYNNSRDIFAATIDSRNLTSFSVIVKRVHTTNTSNNAVQLVWIAWTTG